VKKTTDPEKQTSDPFRDSNNNINNNNNYINMINMEEIQENEAAENSDNSDYQRESNMTHSSWDSAEAEHRAKIKYFEQNPLRTHEIPAGVSMEIYGVKKESGPYPSIPNKLTFKEFNDILCLYKPDFAKKKNKAVDERVICYIRNKHEYDV